MAEMENNNLTLQIIPGDENSELMDKLEDILKRRLEGEETTIVPGQ